MPRILFKTLEYLIKTFDMILDRPEKLRAIKKIPRSDMAKGAMI